MSDMSWKAFTIDELRELLSGFDQWFLDGGLALDLFLGRRTRDHGDIDIGVLSEDAEALLAFLNDCGHEVYDASNGLERVSAPYYGGQSYNYWISDGTHYKVQVLVYKTEENHIIFRRNPAIRWPKEHFNLTIDGLRVVNPLVIYAFKVTTKSAEQKDQIDLISIVERIGLEKE